MEAIIKDNLIPSKNTLLWNAGTLPIIKVYRHRRHLSCLNVNSRSDVLRRKTLGGVTHKRNALWLSFIFKGSPL